MSLFYSGKEIRIYRISSGNKFNGTTSYMTAKKSFFSLKNCFNIFWWWCGKCFSQYSDVFASNEHIYLSWLPKTEVYFWALESQTNHVLSHLTGATIQDDVIVNFQFQRLGSYWQRVIQSFQISMDRLCRLTAKPSKSKAQNPKQYL